MQNTEQNYGLIDLHLHLDGSLSLASVRQLARMQGIAVAEDDAALLEKLQVGEDCRDLNEYLEKFSFPCSLLQTREALATAVDNLAQELAAQGLLYAEIRFAPQLHTLQGLTQEKVVQAAVEGLERSGFKGNLILCCMRAADNREQNLETVRVAARYLGKGMCAVDLAGAEALFPTGDFEAVFLAAKALGVPFTIHAGEAAGPESVKAAIGFGARRIGHGVRSTESPELMEELARMGIPLELCPTSNLNTNIFPDLESYPLARFLEAGVKVTINTDNMTVSNVTLRSEMERIIHTFSLSREQIRMLIQNAVEASFASRQTKEWLHREIERRFQSK